MTRSRARDATELAGREIFHRTGESAIARDGMACASCHPNGRDDGLVWSGPRGRRHSLTLAGNVVRAGAFGWGAEHATLDLHVKETVRRLGGKGLPPDQLDALLTYLRTMKPARAAQASKEPLIARGMSIFHSDRAACATCHAEADRFSDREPHDVGSGGRFLTPSLVGAGARTTFFHDGRFSTLDDLLLGAQRMGGATQLAPDERRALAAYLKTL